MLERLIDAAMDELMAALDEAAPDWRDRLREEEAAGA